MALKITLSSTLLALPSRIGQRVRIAREASALLSETLIKQEIREVDAVASAELVNSIRRLRETKSTTVIGSDKKQAFWIEHGRRPGPVPRWSVFKPILRLWANFKRLALSDSALYLIGQKIRREGYKARQPFHRAVGKLRPRVGNIFRSVFRGL